MILETAANATILIVDDTPSDIRVLSEVLRQEYKTLFATNWKDCLELAASRHPDLILLDVMMPEMNGYELCQRLKADVATRDIPVIFVTALSQEEDETRGLEIGALDYITKPFKPAVVRARVKTHLLIMQQQAELVRKQLKLEEDLQAAGIIQQSLLPGALPELDRADFAWEFQPCEAVGGDILNIVQLDADTVGLYMVDVAGHGPPSAMLSVLVYQMMSPHTGILVDHSTGSPVIRQPEDVLNILDREFPLLRFERHFTIIYMVVNLDTGTLTYSNAAHCTPIVLRGEEGLELLEEAGTFIGLQAFAFGQGTVELAPGDKVVLYSDGLIEMEDAQEQSFGLERLKNAVLALHSAPPGALAKGLRAQAVAYAGDRPLADDLSILTFEYMGRQTAAPV